MKKFKLLIIINLLFFISCSEEKYKLIDKEIINGKVSATQKGIKRYCSQEIKIKNFMFYLL